VEQTEVGARGATGPLAYPLDDPSLLFRADVLEDPAALYAVLRAEAPVWEMPGSATFLVTSADLIVEAVARPEDFSSNLASLIFRGDDGRPVAFDMAPLGHATHVLATADPPVHTLHRKLLQPRLTPGRMATLEADVVAMVDTLLDPMLSAGRGDVMATLADPLPAQVINRVIGLPIDDAEMLVSQVLETNEILAGIVDAAQMQRAAESAVETSAYLGRHLEAAMAVPDDENLLGTLAGGVRDGGLSFDEGVGILVQLVGAGTETTTSLIGTAVRRLAEDADLQARVRREPAAIPAFVEEMLRVDGPFRFHYRTTPHPTSLGGVAIPAGARVLLMWAAANLDSAAYPEPARVDVDRPLAKSHLAFGRGIHLCIGAPLARLEARIAIERLLSRTTRLRLDPDQSPRQRPNIFLRRLAALPVVLDGG
jgi:cytochrome P450 family 144